jgi:hypothetical protein
MSPAAPDKKSLPAYKSSFPADSRTLPLINHISVLLPQWEADKYQYEYHVPENFQVDY